MGPNIVKLLFLCQQAYLRRISREYRLIKDLLWFLEGYAELTFYGSVASVAQVAGLGLSVQNQQYLCLD